MPKDLSEIRKNIDKIDEQMLKLFLERMDCSRQVAEYKTAHGLPVLNTKREQEILDEIAEKSGKYAENAKLLFSMIMNISRAAQYPEVTKSSDFRQVMNSAKHYFCPKTAAFQGTDGSYSQKAASILFPDAEMQSYSHFEDVFIAVRNGEKEVGIVPAENSFAGSVSENYDNLLKYGLKINAMVDLPINHCLLVKKGVDLSKIKTVYSHPQALAQCADFISSHGFEPHPIGNTAFAAKMVAESDDDSIAAIASEQTSDLYELSIAARAIQTSGANFTRFMAVSKDMAVSDDADHISIAVAIPNNSGSLCKTLSMLASCGIDMSKIESRPDKESPFQYIFYIDFAGNIRDEKTAALLCGLHDELPMLTLIGNCKIIEK